MCIYLKKFLYFCTEYDQKEDLKGICKNMNI